jgi:putative two-component system response regulator
MSTIRIISQGDGHTMPHHFDPAVVASFLTQADRFEAIYAQYAED